MRLQSETQCYRFQVIEIPAGESYRDTSATLLIQMSSTRQSSHQSESVGCACVERAWQMPRRQSLQLTTAIRSLLYLVRSARNDYLARSVAYTAARPTGRLIAPARPAARSTGTAVTDRDIKALDLIAQYSATWVLDAAWQQCLAPMQSFVQWFSFSSQYSFSQR